MPPRQAQALWITGPDEVELRREPYPNLGPDDVLVETLFSGISRGTERLVLGGGVPETEHQRMQAPFQEGEFPWPVKYGYAAVGRVVDGPPERIGEVVFALHPHQDLFSVPGEAALPLPQAVPPERAVLAANMETALNIAWDAETLPGDRVAVVGAGLVGLLVARLSSRIPGVEIQVIDVDERKSACARMLGLQFAHPDLARPGQDVVIHTSATEAGLGSAIALAGREARIVEASWYGDRDVSIPLGSVFHSRRLTITSSQVGAVPPSRRIRWSNHRRLAKALDLLADTALDHLVTGETAFEDLAQDYCAILSAPATLCHRVRYMPAPGRKGGEGCSP